MTNQNSNSRFGAEMRAYPPQNGTVCQNVRFLEQQSPSYWCGANDLSAPNWAVDQLTVGGCTTYNNGVPTYEPNKLIKVDLAVRCP